MQNLSIHLRFVDDPTLRHPGESRHPYPLFGEIHVQDDTVPRLAGTLMLPGLVHPTHEEMFYRCNTW